MLTLKLKYRKFVAVLLLLLISLPVLTIIGTVIEFEINRNYYAAEKCIQKEVQDNCCKGSCVLSEKINTVQNQTEDESSLIPTENIDFIISKNEILKYLNTIITEDYGLKLVKINTSKSFAKIIAPPPELG